ncbi:MAG: hypothetical protein WDZ84_06220 [Rhodovibrionaceae bacterium]
MTFLSRSVAAITAVMLIGGCSSNEDALWPSVDAQSAESQSAQNAGPPLLGTGTFEPEGVTAFAPTGTAVGQRVQAMRGDLSSIQSNISAENARLQSLRSDARASANNYHNLIGNINARLQVGTTPGNPELVAQWNQAQSELGNVDSSISSMNSLANEVSSTSSRAVYLLNSIRATYNLSGAVDEDHRQLEVLEDEGNQTVVLIDRLLTELTEDVARASNYLVSERADLTTMATAIKNGDYLGGSLANRAYGTPAPQQPGGAASQVGRSQPLVVIRFDRPDVNYEQALFNAVSQALERRPQAAFDLVAVAPGGGTTGEAALASNATQRNAEQVMRSLTNMGLPPDRISLSSTTNPSGNVNEVHIYVR